MTLLVPNVQPPRHIIDPVAFFVALIGAPLVFALFTFWAFFVPVAAVFFGGPVYLAFGTPVLLWVLSKRDPNFREVIGWSWAAVLVLVGLIWAYSTLVGARNGMGMIQLYGGFGFIFAPGWSATFLALYLWLRRDFYAQAIRYS